MEAKDPRVQFSEQIARLQQRQLELVRQASDELEALKQEVESDRTFEDRLRQETRPLMDEVAELRATVRQLQEQMDGSLQAMQEGVGGSLRRLEGRLESFASEASRDLGDALRTIRPAVPPSSLPAALPQAAKLPAAAKPKGRFLGGRTGRPVPAAPMKQAPAPAPIPSIAPAKTARRRGAKALVRSAVYAALIGAGLWGGHAVLLPPSQIGEVAGVSTEAPSASPQPQDREVSQDYKESFADLPFEQTTWDQFYDADFGITMEYPTNTTNRIHVPGSDNLWFLRKNGYLLKISRLASEQSLDEWIDGYRKDAGPASYTKTTFTGLPAYKITGNGIQAAPGYTYAIATKGAIYQIWIKDEPPTTDDGQRLARMITSIQFTQ